MFGTSQLLYLCQKTKNKKNIPPKSLNVSRPVAFFSLVMTPFEKTVRDELLDTVQAKLDLFQFAYRPGGGVGEFGSWGGGDATGASLHMILSHL